MSEIKRPTFKKIRNEIKSLFPKEANFRCKGFSTRIALRIISEAYSNPNDEIKIIDHYGTKEADRNLSYMIQDYINRLEFSGFIIKKKTHSFYLIYKEED